jgi:hypothetical protein
MLLTWRVLIQVVGYVNISGLLGGRVLGFAISQISSLEHHQTAGNSEEDQK